MTDISFQAWKDETLANQQKNHAEHTTYLQQHFQPRQDYETQVAEYLETNKSLREEYIKKKTKKIIASHISYHGVQNPRRE